MIAQPFSPDDYLGPFADDATDEQKTALVRASEMIDARYPDPDDDSGAAMSGAAQIILDGSTLTDLAGTYARARRAEREAMAQLTGAIIAASATTSESELARASGLNRLTVRKALGK